MRTFTDKVVKRHLPRTELSRAERRQSERETGKKQKTYTLTQAQLEQKLKAVEMEATKKAFHDQVDFKDMPPIEISDGCSNEPDMIQKPPHYNKFTFQPIDIIAEVTNYYEGSTAFHIGTVLKYLCRAPFKGKLLEDLKKANYYLIRAIEEMEEEQ